MASANSVGVGSTSTIEIGKSEQVCVVYSQSLMIDATGTCDNLTTNHMTDGDSPKSRRNSRHTTNPIDHH